MDAFIPPVQSLVFRFLTALFFAFADELGDAITVGIVVLDLALQTIRAIFIGSACISGLSRIATGADGEETGKLRRVHQPINPHATPTPGPHR